MQAEQLPFATNELGLYHSVITRTLTQVVESLAGLSASQLNWRPPGLETNTVYALVTHVLANSEENICGTLRERFIARDPVAEWASSSDDVALLQARLAEVLAGITQALAATTAGDLDRTYLHPRRGEITGRGILLVVVQHTAMHEGQIQLTRDLLLAAGV